MFQPVDLRFFTKCLAYKNALYFRNVIRCLGNQRPLRSWPTDIIF